MSINPAVTAEVFRLHQMALLLEKEPTRFVVGTREEFPMFDDFPTDDRPLSERAFEYFGHEGLQNIVRCVMEQYHASLMPLELLNMYNK
jgi:nitrogenase molybdenum-iron protein alpha/beta subunit